jgi:phage-related protein
MTVPVFTPPRMPSVGSGQTFKAKVLVAEFGDGYSQRAADGINNVRQTRSLVWDNLKLADAEAISIFLAARKGAESFLWAANGDIARRWICSSWERISASNVTDKVTATFTEVFDL